MNLKHLAETAGLLITSDSIHVQAVRLASGVPSRIRRFGQFIHEVVVAPHTRPNVAAARLVALDGIRPDSLPRLDAALSSLFVWQRHVHVEWSEEVPPRLERRALSATTVSALQVRAPSAPDGMPLADELQAYLKTSQLYQKFPAKERVKELSRDALCWWYQSLPLPLFFHAAGLQVMSAVARVCLARQDTGQVPIIVAPTIDAAAELMDVESCAELLDVAAMSSGNDESGVVLAQAILKMEVKSGETDAATLRRWVKELLQLRQQALQAGPINALLLAWIVDICESGTLREENPSRETPKRYFVSAADSLRLKLNGLPDAISDWSTDVLSAIYDELVEEETEKNPRGTSAHTLATALTNFHAFLVEWFEVQPLQRRLHAKVPMLPVRAKVIWPEEIGCAVGWINDLTDDRQIRTMLKIIFGINKEAAARSTELLLLRIGNVQSFKTYMEVEVAPSLRWGRLKTRAGQRRLRISDPYVMSLISSWIDERRAKGASDLDLLFADPKNGQQVYRRHLVSTLVSSLLKAATGDQSAVGYDLRHTVISGRNADVLASSSTTDINRLSDNATGYGHVSGMTSLVSYTHLYELALRQWLDVAMVTLVPLTSADTAALTGLSASNVRQSAGRHGTSSAVFGWWKVREPDNVPAYPTASALWQWRAPVAPRPRAAGTFEPTVSITLLMVAELASKVSTGEVGKSFNISEPEARHLQERAITVAHEVARLTWPVKYGPRVALPIGLMASLGCADVDVESALDAKPKFQRLIDWLSARQSFSLLSDAYQSWRDCRLGSHLSLDKPGRVLGLLRVLAAAGVDPLALRVCYRAEKSDPANVPSELRVAQQDFTAVFGMKPRVFAVEERMWDATTYLLWDSDDCINAPTGASGTIDGLDALMFGVGVHINAWNQRGNEDDSTSH